MRRCIARRRTHRTLIGLQATDAAMVGRAERRDATAVHVGLASRRRCSAFMIDTDKSHIARALRVRSADRVAVVRRRAANAGDRLRASGRRHHEQRHHDEPHRTIVDYAGERGQGFLLVHARGYRPIRAVVACNRLEYLQVLTSWR
jgi:hypothetical protein